MCFKKKKSNADHIPLTLNQCIDIIDKILFLEQGSISWCPCKEIIYSSSWVIKSSMVLF